MPHNLLAELQHNLMKNFININIEKYDYTKYKELFSLVLKSAQNLLSTYSPTITHTSIGSESVHIVIGGNNSQYSLDSKLYVIFSIQDFIVNNIEVSILH